MITVNSRCAGGTGGGNGEMSIQSMKEVGKELYPINLRILKKPSIFNDIPQDDYIYYHTRFISVETWAIYAFIALGKFK